jgi:hypothetical protein
MMTLEKQVEIPANRHIHMDVDFTLPESWTPGEVISLLIRPIPQTASTVEVVVPRHRLTERQRAAIKECRGLAKRMGFTATSDDFFEQRRKDNELENRLDALHEEERRLDREQRQGRK